MGIWKDYEELENSLSMPELIEILVVSRDKHYEQQKFMAALKGIDLEKEAGRKSSNEWEDMKARVFSGGATSNSDDVLSLQGVNAARAGFGIGNGLEYSDLKNTEPKNPFG